MCFFFSSALDFWIKNKTFYRTVKPLNLDGIAVVGKQKQSDICSRVVLDIRNPSTTQSKEQLDYCVEVILREAYCSLFELTIMEWFFFFDSCYYLRVTQRHQIKKKNTDFSRKKKRKEKFFYSSHRRWGYAL